MTVSVGDIHDYACSLAMEGPEVVLRSAVGRAYYSAYHACRSWHICLPAPGRNVGPDGGVHQQLINQLRNPDPSIGPERSLKSRQIASQLDDLKAKRTLADYSIEDHVDLYIASEACLQAKKILAKLNS